MGLRKTSTPLDPPNQSAFNIQRDQALFGKFNIDCGSLFLRWAFNMRILYLTTFRENEEGGWKNKYADFHCPPEKLSACCERSSDTLGALWAIRRIFSSRFGGHQSKKRAGKRAPLKIRQNQDRQLARLDTYSSEWPETDIHSEVLVCWLLNVEGVPVLVRAEL